MNLGNPFKSSGAPAVDLHDKVSILGRYVAPVLFTLSILFSAGLLFFIQPLLTRMVTPLAGGAPGVWTTAALFFQCAMIGGALYAHLLTRLPRIRHQIGLHLMLWLCASSFLPMALPVDWAADPNASIQVQTLALYGATIGLPFFFLAANAPLIQTWYGRTRGPSAHDPYFLYGASNVGALIALLAFPFVVEPFFTLRSMSLGWSITFIGLGGLLFMSAFTTTRDHPDAKTVIAVGDRRSDLRTIWTWGAIAFVPSSLMLALTTKVTTDFGSMPLLWVIPLALYLLTYAAGFTRRSLVSDRCMVRIYPVAIAVLALAGMTSVLGRLTIWTAIAMALAFTIVSFHLHRKLYKLRPDTSRLTVYYLTISIGGAAGGLFNAIIAPSLMSDMQEFPLTVLAACSVLLIGKKRSAALDWPLTGALVAGLMLLMSIDPATEVLHRGSFHLVLAAGLVVAAGLLGSRQTVAPGVVLFCMLSAASIMLKDDPETVYKDRNFFGLHKVIDNGHLRAYVNGTTVHGGQVSAEKIDPEPIYYYRRSGPLGQVARSDAWTGSDRVGLVGLGIGAMTAYRTPGQKMSIYEIDPEVIRIARNPELFSFLSSYAPDAAIHVGDARIMLARQMSNAFGVLMIDAYSSDSVPMHLSTVEAMKTFMEDVKPGGILAYHISNRYFDLARPLAAAAAHLGFEAWYTNDVPSKTGDIAFDTPVKALVVTRPGERPGFLTTPAPGEPVWTRLEVPATEAWLDEQSSPFTALKAP